MHKFAVIATVVGLASVSAQASNLSSSASTALGASNFAQNAVLGGANDGSIVWDNGVANGVNAITPTAGWDANGIIDDFVLPDGGGTAFSGIRVEMIDGTTPLGTGTSTIQSFRARIYEISTGLDELDFDISVPVFDSTYSIGDGNLTQVDSGQDFFTRDLIYFDASGPATDLGPGTFALFINFPGTGVVDSYLGYSDGNLGQPGQTARVFGSGVNGEFGAPSDVAFNLSIPEPASIALLGLGAMALIRRRR